MAEEFKPVTLVKDGKEKVVSSIRAYHQARFDGWRDQEAPAADRPAEKAPEPKAEVAKPAPKPNGGNGS